MSSHPAIEEVDVSQLPKWLRSSSVGWLGALVAAVTIMLAFGFLLHEEQGLEAGEIQSAEFYARALQDHADRTFDTIDVVTGSLADSLGAELREGDTDRANRDLAQALQGLAFLRSLSVIDAAGRVMASSSPENLDVLVDLAAIPPPAPGSADRLGASVRGRDLIDARSGANARAGSAVRTFLPLVRSVGDPYGTPRFLVAVINPDYFANEHELALADTTRGAAIFSIGGEMVSGTGSIRMSPGDVLRGHRFFSEFLPARESGSFIGRGIDGESVVTAFRVLRKRPLVIVVERAYASIAAELRKKALWTIAVCGGALAVLGAMVFMGWRSMKSHEAVSAALESTRQRVAASARDLRGLVDSVHELIFRADAQGRIAFVNSRWTGLIGRTPSALIGLRLADLCRADERQSCDALFEPSRSGPQTIVVHIDSVGGRSCTLELSVSPVLDAEDALVGFAGFAVDVTEREAAQQALRSQLEFSGRLLEVSPTPLFVKDECGRFVSVNRAWLELMNFSRADVLGRDSSDLFAHEAEKHRAKDADLLLSGEQVRYENRLLVAGRAPRDTIVTKVRFMRADGSAAGIVGSIIDVTEFRDAERRIREARDVAQIANGAKSEFIANISHELRTPLQGIIGFSEVGQDMANDRPDFAEMFADIHAGGQRMLTLVNGLLDVSQMDGTAGSLPLQRIDIAVVVREAVGQVQAKAALRGLKFEPHGLNEPVEADVDRARFQQAVRNVLANAARYSPPGSAIEVRLVDRGRAGVELTVRDHGPGVPENELERIFDAFVQSSRTRDGSGGTGLGLTITRKIMSAHGGSIVAANAPGGGALMSMSLPAAGVVADARQDLSWQDPDGLLFATQEH
jgi:PAS domain S-box-containing protein